MAWARKIISTEIKIKLKIYKDEKYLFIEIENDGELLTKTFEELLQNGTGLKNTQDRLKTLYGNEVSFKVENTDDNNKVVTFIKLPLRR